MEAWSILTLAEVTDLLSNRSHPCGELLAAHLAGLVVVPPLEHDGDVVEQLSTDSTGRTVALGERHKFPDEMSLMSSST
jgi:hypothetical protein